MIWLAVGGCLLVSFVFSGIEAGILSVNRVRLKHRLKMGDSAARTLDRLLARRGRILVTAQAYGASGARRTIQATVVRAGAAIRMVTWREVV